MPSVFLVVCNEKHCTIDLKCVKWCTCCNAYSRERTMDIQTGKYKTVYIKQMKNTDIWRMYTDGKDNYAWM